MNRIIKFRGKDFQTGEWLYGDLRQRLGYLPSIVERYFNGNGKVDYCEVSVKENTIGQFTGLHDRNGKEIYEGDIITVRGDYPRVILWDKVSWAIMPCELYNDKHFWIMNLQHPGSEWWEEFADEMEVVGNIYDNPELLNGKQSKS